MVIVFIVMPILAAVFVVIYPEMLDARADIEVIIVPDNPDYAHVPRFYNELREQQIEKENAQLLRQQIHQDQLRSIQEHQYLNNQLFQKYPMSVRGQ